METMRLTVRIAAGVELVQYGTGRSQGSLLAGTTVPADLRVSISHSAHVVDNGRYTVTGDTVTTEK